MYSPASSAATKPAPVNLDIAKIAKATGCTVIRASAWVAPLNNAMQRFGIDTPLRQAAFLPQVGHESARLSTVEENLNYSAEALLRVFTKYFPTLPLAQQYARQPAKIANRVYANRMGNGNEASGDGWKFRGKGPIQLTGHDNHLACGKALGVDLIANPELLLLPEYGAAAAGWFWKVNSLNVYADKQDAKSISKIINTGNAKTPDSKVIGLPERLALYDSAVKALLA